MASLLLTGRSMLLFLFLDRIITLDVWKLHSGIVHSVLCSCMLHSCHSVVVHGVCMMWGIVHSVSKLHERELACYIFASLLTAPQ